MLHCIVPSMHASQASLRQGAAAILTTDAMQLVLKLRRQLSAALPEVYAAGGGRRPTWYRQVSDFNVASRSFASRISLQPGSFVWHTRRLQRPVLLLLNGLTAGRITSGMAKEK